MEFNLEIEVDEHRLIIRKLLLESIVQNLHEEHGIPLRDIAAELLVVASMVVSDDDCEVNNLINYSIDFDESDEDVLSDESDEDALDDDDDWENEWRLKSEFRESTISKEIESLIEKISKLERLDRYDEALVIKENLLSKLPGHAELWVSTIDNTEEYHSHFEYLADSMLRGYVVLMDADKMANIMQYAEKLYSILGDNKIDLEIFEHDYLEYLSDIDNMQRIYNFISLNPNFPQKNIFRELSLDGRQSRYMLDAASKYGKITRIRYKDTWLLSMVN